MNVIQVVPAISNEASGPSYSVLRLTNALQERGHQTSTCSLSLDSEPVSSGMIRTFPLGVGPKRLGRSPEMYKWLRSVCRSRGTEILHNHGMWQMNAIYPGWAIKGTGTKLLYSPRGALSEWAMNSGSSVKGVFWSLLQKPALIRAECFHATSVAEYREIRRLGFTQPVSIIPNGIDIPPLNSSTTEDPTHGRTLLFLSRIHKVKGVDILLTAWSVIQDKFPEWKLKIVGGDDGYYGSTGYLDYLRGIAREMSLSRVEFCGPLYGEVKDAMYREAEAFVLPTHSENFGMAVAEALSHGTPAIVSKGAPWEGLEKTGSGWWVDVGVDPLVECLEEALAKSPAELSLMGRRGRQWMEEEFSWETVASRMEATYKWLLDRSIPVPQWVHLD